ncbi:MAG: 16S rRNA (cytosine(967)-C(5))-methyltransferase RsmB [Ruminococcaceae bacterium]|nr:16S rRNA (cytosine(967)-C(5))-methyltransferase RsmB [Oscillospiraceae bacterium]
MERVNPARAAAFASLLKMKGGKYTNLEINATLNRSDMSEEDRGLYTALVYGVVERAITLDKIISRYSRTPLDKTDEEALVALRLGIYQLSFMDRVPDHAAVDESVSLAGKKAKGFVNAVLRSFIRDGKSAAFPKEESIDYLSVAFSVPEELCRRFIGWYGFSQTEEIFKAFLEREKISLRVNTLKISVNEAAKMLLAEISPVCENSITVNSFEGVSQGIENGLWFVQDTASTLCSQILGALPGETVVDTCACPGGKSFAVAVGMENKGELFSFDLHKNKLSLIEKGAKKLGISIIKTAERDAREPDALLCGKADRVLCDAPCSGLGVIGKKPDIKYKELSSVDRLPDIQYEVLCGASEYVKSGGTLVYSTCTLNPEENFGVCRRFLESHPSFSLAPFSWAGGECQGSLTLFPHTDKTDGFYICKMVKE